MRGLVAAAVAYAATAAPLRNRWDEELMFTPLAKQIHDAQFRPCPGSGALHSWTTVADIDNMSRPRVALSKRRRGDAAAATRIRRRGDAAAATRIRRGSDAAVPTRIRRGSDAAAATRILTGPPDSQEHISRRERQAKGRPRTRERSARV